MEIRLHESDLVGAFRTYRSPKAKDRTEVSSTYSNVRRFLVIVDERVAAPSPDR